MSDTKIATREAGRELDGLIETQVFGRCDHDMQYVTDGELESRARRDIMAEWQKEYGKQPPDAFVMAEAESRRWAETSGDYSPKECVKCGVSAYGTSITPRYSTQIEHAWRVVEKMRGAWDVSLTEWAEGWCCTLDAETPREIWAQAETAPHAICLAALKAVGSTPQGAK